MGDQMLDDQNNEDQTITFLIVKASHKIKFLNKYVEGFKIEIEELSEKYDKLAFKLRDATKDIENLTNVREVLQVQKDT